ncbi:MAG: hypothetical protein KGZ50_01075 [Peptococcaceae bacterium]|nr:hypothetical protein [Peptococcaceae bacterium]
MQRTVSSGLLYFLLVILLVEGVTRVYIVDRAFLSPYGELARISDNLERHRGLPKVAFFGSSQTQAAIATREMTEHLGIEPYLLVNASAAAGGPREMFYLFKSNRELFREIKVVYLNVDTWMFNRHTFMAEQQGSTAWRRNATWRDRLTFPTKSTTRADWILGWVYATWDQRDTWRFALRDWFRNPWTYNPTIVYDCFGRPVAGFLTADRPLTHEILVEEAKILVDSQMQHFEMNLGAYDDLAQLVAVIRAQGAEPVFLRVPTSPEYLAAKAAAKIDEDGIWLRFYERFADVAMLDLSGIILSDLQYWWDPYHMSRTGAMVLALSVVTDLRQRLEFP